MSPPSIPPRFRPVATGVLAWITLVGTAGPSVRAEPSPQEASPAQRFEQTVLPVLQKRCFECHSHQGKIKGGLALDSRAGWTTGGDSGPALVAGHPEKSLLMTAIRYQDDDLQMPPKGRLPDGEVKILEDWIRQGAFDPRDSARVAKALGIDFTEGAKWWAWQRPRPVAAPAVRDPAWPRTDLDRFILAGLEAKGLRPAADADRITLIRRLSFALLGLPPTPAAAQAFASDSAPDALERCVDRMLASPHFGEHWARHWMDVVHYSETHGLERDALLPFAWRYRDYLIDAFNDDLPFDRLTQEHIAGDLLAPRWRDGKNQAPIGTAFWRFVEFFQTPVDVKREEVAVIDSQIDTLTKGFQALTVSCARCHDHKFDPIADEDFYALYGIVRSSRAATHVLEPPENFTRENAALEKIKADAPAILSEHWKSQFASWPKRLKTAADFIAAIPKLPERERPAIEQLPVDPWRRAFALTAWAKRRTVLGTLLPLVQACDESEFASTFEQLAREALDADPPVPDHVRSFADFRSGLAPGWRLSGAGLPTHSQPGGEIALATTGDGALRAVHPAGYFSDGLSDRHGGMLRSPDFVIDSDWISVLASGHNDARLRLVVENFQGDGDPLFLPVNVTLEYSLPQWHTWQMREQWKGRRAYIEIMTRDDRPYIEVAPVREKFESTDGRSSFGIVEVLFHSGSWKPRLSLLPETFWKGPVNSWEDIGQRLGDAVAAAVEAWRAGRATQEEWLLLQEATALGLLETRADRNAPALADLTERYRYREKRIPIATRAPGLRDDGDGLDSEVFPRGNHLRPGPAVPRRFLQVMGSQEPAYRRGGSGRLPLAEELASPENPLTARVMVNRVWHWLFSCGLVSSVDNFGKLGTRPTHPELLDHLATEFVKDGWSIKRLIRRIVLSRTWQLSSEPSAAALEVDPANQWLQHFSARRLDAEEIRDAMLAVAGNADPTIGGMPVRNHYRVSVDPTQAPSGPLDGHGRRSLYLEMRRNCRSDFLEVFDQPKPVVTTGARPLSNVPAQSLTLLNHPFVLNQARLWAERVTQEAGGAAARLDQLFLEAFCRLPTEEDRMRLGALLPAEDASAESWAAVAHVVFNHKEFLYIP